MPSSARVQHSSQGTPNSCVAKSSSLCASRGVPVEQLLCQGQNLLVPPDHWCQGVFAVGRGKRALSLKRAAHRALADPEYKMAQSRLRKEFEQLTK
jgi:hypothetical protein